MTTNRFIALMLTLVIGVQVAACATPEETRTEEKASNLPKEVSIIQTTGGGISKSCDAGRAIYTYKHGYAGGIAVVENAKECANAN